MALFVYGLSGAEMGVRPVPWLRRRAWQPARRDAKAAAVPDQPSGDNHAVAAGILFGEVATPIPREEPAERVTAVAASDFERVVRAAAVQFGADTCRVESTPERFIAVFSTAHCMVECGVALRQEFSQRGWYVRQGGHYGDAWRNESGDLVGPDVHQAARIQSAADATQQQFLVSDVVPAVVRNRVRHIRFEARGPMAGPEALAVSEVLPAADPEGRTSTPRAQPGGVSRPVARRGSRWPVGRTGTAITLVGVALLLMVLAWEIASVRPHLPGTSGSPTLPGEVNAIAVMEFENQRTDDPRDDWYAKALQTAFNTELSKIPQLTVIAPEIIQHAARDARLDRMAAARELGVNRFVTGSFAVVGDNIRIDARIVDTVNGFQEAAENVEGAQDQFFSLQKQLALATLEHFRVRLTAAQAASIRKTTNSRLDKYRMLLDAEGVTSEASERAPQPTAPEASQPVDDPPSHRGDTSWFRPQFLSSVAYAQAPPAPEGAARQVLEEYRQAQEAGDLQRLASLYVAFPEGQRKKITKYLHNVAQLHVEFADVQIQPRGDELAVSYTRRDRFVDKETGEPVSLEVRVTKFLVNDSGTWKFAEGE